MRRIALCMAQLLILLLLPHAPLVAEEAVSTGSNALASQGSQSKSAANPVADASPEVDAGVAGPAKSSTSSPSPKLKTADEATPEKAADKKQRPSVDRRWIIKESPSLDPKKLKKAPKSQVAWKNAAQRSRCEGYLNDIGGLFLKARYYSIQGDSCACAAKADDFLELYQRAETACPDNYLAGEGYTPRIARNMSWLSALGKEQCVGPAGSPAVAPTKKQEATKKKEGDTDTDPLKMPGTASPSPPPPQKRVSQPKVEKQ